VAAEIEFGHHRDGLGFGAPADGEGARDRPMLDSRHQGGIFLSGHYLTIPSTARLARRNQVWLVTA
jgi:hypothetical protein